MIFSAGLLIGLLIAERYYRMLDRIRREQMSDLRARWQISQQRRSRAERAAEESREWRTM